MTDCYFDKIREFRKAGFSMAESISKAVHLQFSDEIERISTSILTFSVEKRGDKWCVVHGHEKKKGSDTDKPKGSVIKCFDSKDEAEKMHDAIMANKGSKNSNSKSEKYAYDRSGKGKGKEPTGDGGTSMCVCPKCKKEYSHEKGTPCSEMTCKKCDVPLVGRK